MLKTFVAALLLSSCMYAQLAPTASPAQAPETAAEIPPTAPVITLAGLCPNAAAGTPKTSPECKTVVTKAEFEKIIDTLNPKLPPSARQNVAADYAKMLVFSDLAKKRGLEDTPRFKELLQFLKMQVAAQELVRSVQEESKPSQAEIQKYYDANPSKFEEVSLKRLFIPRNTPNAKTTDPRPTDESLKAEGEKARARLVAGEDFDKVEKDIYDSKGYKVPPPPTSIPNWRREAAPPAQAPVFDLKQGEFSSVMVEPAGAYVYKLEQKKAIPLEEVKNEIESQLGSEKMRANMDALTSSVKPEMNEAYFRSLGAPPPSRPGMVGPAVNAPNNVKAVPGPTAQTTGVSPSATPGKSTTQR